MADYKKRDVEIAAQFMKETLFNGQTPSYVDHQVVQDALNNHFGTSFSTAVAKALTAQIEADKKAQAAKGPTVQRASRDGIKERIQRQQQKVAKDDALAALYKMESANLKQRSILHYHNRTVRSASQMLNSPEREARHLLGYFNMPTTGKKFSANGVSGETDLINSINASNIVNSKGALKVGGKPIWSHVVSGSTYGPYSQMAIHAQEQIEVFNKFAKNMNSKAKGKGFNALDIETLGNMDDPSKFHISEIAVQGFEVDSAGELQPSLKSNRAFSQVIAHDGSMHAYLLDTINKVHNDTKVFHNLSRADQITLINTIRYSDVKNIQHVRQGLGRYGFNQNMPKRITRGGTGFQGAIYGGSGTNQTLVHNSLIDQLIVGKDIQTDELLKNFGTYRQHMIKGLEALQAHGTPLEQAKANYKSFMETNKNRFFVTQNGTNFDFKGLGLMGFGGAPQKHIDFLHLKQAAYADPAAMHFEWNKNRANQFTEGPLSLFEDRITFGLDTTGTHSGTADVGEHGLGGVFAKAWKSVSNKINSNKAVNIDGYHQRMPDLAWNDTPYQVGQKLYAPRAIINTNKAVQDFRAVQGDNGFIHDSGSFMNTLADAESFYEVRGIREIEHQKNRAYALELMNPETNRSSFIIREGEKARYELASFMQKNFYTWDTITPDLQNEILGNNAVDKARRRYERMFGLHQSATTGFDAVKRMYGNARAAAEGRTGDLNFNSMWNSKKKMFVHNELEARDFEHMKSRLISELPVMEDALRSIEETLPVGASKGAEAKHIGMQRTMALQDFTRQMDQTVGPHVTERRRLANERYSTTLDDYASDRGKTFTLNYGSLDEMDQSVFRYINQDAKRLEATPAKAAQAQQERMRLMMLSLEEKGMIEKSAARSIIEQHDGMNLTNRVTSKTIASDLMNVLRINKTNLEVESMAARDLKDLNVETVRTMMATVNERAANRYIAVGSGPNAFANLKDRPGIGGILRELDQPHPITGLEPNNAPALESLLSSILGKDGLDASISMNGDYTAAHVHVFRRADSLSALDQINRGLDPSNAVRLTVPMITRQGEIVHNNTRVNAHMDYIHYRGENQMISSAQRIAMAHEFTLFGENGILNMIGSGEFDKAQERADRTVSKQIQFLGSVSPGILSGPNDTMYRQGNLGDVTKQSHVNVSSAMIHEYYRDKKLIDGDFRDTPLTRAFHTGKDGAKQLSYFVTNDNLNLEAADRIRREMPEWAAKNIPTPLYLSGVKDDKFISGSMSMTDTRDLYAYGDFTAQGRSNSVQGLNTDLIKPQLQERIQDVAEKEGFPVSFKNMVSTPKMEDILSSGDYVPQGHATGMYLHGAYITGPELHERTMALASTPEGMGILNRAGMLHEDGTLNSIKLATVFEQQTAINKNLMEQLQFSRTYTIDISENFRAAKKMLDKNGSFRIGSVFGADSIIGHHLPEEGGRGEPQRLRNVISRLVGASDDKLTFEYMENTHKLYMDIEKTSVDAFGGTTQELLDAVTGKEGTAFIYNPDVGKHLDLGPVLRGQANKFSHYLNTASTDVQGDIAKIESAGVGLKHVQDADGFHRLIASAKGMDGAELAKNTTALMADLGIKEREEVVVGGKTFHTTTTIQEVRPAHVNNYSKTVGADRMINGEMRGVRYGLREVGIFRELGLNNVADDIYRQMEKDMQHGMMGSGMKPYMESMKDTLRSLTGVMDNSVPTYRVNDFEPLPILDGNQETYRGTVLDSSRYNPDTAGGRGFYLELPSQVNADGTGNRVYRKSGKKTVEMKKIYIPHLPMQGQDNEFWKTPMQRSIQKIYAKASEIEDLKKAGGNKTQFASAFSQLNDEVGGYAKQVRDNLSSSKGMVLDDMLKVNMPNSSTGLGKIISPDIALKDEFTFISPETAKKLDVYDHITRGGAEMDWRKQADFYTPNLRFPAFHNEAVAISKLRVQEGVGDNHLVTPLIASMMRMDVDGDYNNFLALKGQASQDDLAKGYRKQIADAASRRNIAFNESMGTLLGDVKAKEFGKYFASDGHDFTLQDYVSGGAFDQLKAMNTDAEVTAKSGKAFVGMASDLNFQMRQLARDLPEDQRMIVSNFGTGLEQKLISAKHVQTEGANGKMVLKSGALEFLQAIRTQNWDEAVRIDNTRLGSQFTEGFNLEQAADIFRGISKESWQDPHLRLGTGSGMSGATDHQILDLYNGKAPDSIHRNDAGYLINLLNQNGTEASDAIYDNIAEGTGGRRINPPGANDFVDPKQFHAENPGSRRSYTSALERGVSKVWDTLSNSRTAKQVGIAALAVGGVLAAVQTVSPMRIMPENRPYNKEEMQSEVPPNPQPQMQRTARVEENGSGLSVQVHGRAPGHFNNEHIGGLVQQGIHGSGIQANVNVNSRDDTSTINQQWMEQQVSSLITKGHAMG